MRISELKLDGSRHYVQTNTDALRIVQNQFDVDQYIKSFGDVEIEQDYYSGLAASANHWLVPEFTKSIENYVAMKTRECAKWGCE